MVVKSDATVKTVATDADWPALMDAGRTLVAEGGLRALSLRSIASASGWTMGELGYRIGKKEQLIAWLVDAERETMLLADAAWLDRLSGPDEMDVPTLTAAMGGYLDDCATNRRAATIFWEEILLEAGLDSQLSPLVGPWIDERVAFWHVLLEGRHPQADILARTITCFVAEEQMYTLVLGQNPVYRLMRDIRIRRLCGGLLAGPDRQGAVLFENLLGKFVPADSWGEAMTERAQAVARMTGKLLMERGLSAVTHRGVAAALGMSPSAVAHHFRTQMDLVRSGIEALYETFYAAMDLRSIRQQLVADPTALGGVVDPTGAAADLSRAAHMINLVGARDPKFVPLVARRLTERGRSSSRWIGALFATPERYDRCAAQITSMVLGGEVFLTLARGLPYAGQSSPALADLVALARS